MRMLPSVVLILAAFLRLGGCAAMETVDSGRSPEPTGLNGYLLIIGGGLDDDNKPVYERMIELARASAGRHGRESPLIVIATAASGNQDSAAKGKVQSIGAYCPACRVETIMRETPTDRTVELVDAADAMFFTGGDQKRITTRYLANDQDTPESLAMRRLLERGGVIAGTSAGDAMMSDPMFLTGRSAEALGIRSTRTQRGEDDDADDRRPERERPLGPQIGKGMNFIPWVITDSHFFERHRFGRLVAALEVSGKRLGLG
ncbi:MAG: cyanophycinase, partial [Phycisphaerales bacterium]